jgi:hypothetical protein
MDQVYFKNKILKNENDKINEEKLLKEKNIKELQDTVDNINNIKEKYKQDNFMEGYN